jgi:hypothetical protein
MDKKLIGLMLVFLVAFTLFTSMVIFNKPLSQLTRASASLVADPNSSLILVWPLTAKANGTTPVEINVFIRNDSKNGAFALANKQVKLNTTSGIIKENNLITDKKGKATFSLVSSTPGVAEITAEVPGDNVIIKQKSSVKFE